MFKGTGVASARPSVEWAVCTGPCGLVREANAVRCDERAMAFGAVLDRI